MRCPPNSHYSLCVNPCPAACPGVQEVVQLPTPCAEGCECDDGFFPAGRDCVPVDHCSCFHNGQYFPVSILLGPCESFIFSSLPSTLPLISTHFLYGSPLRTSGCTSPLMLSHFSPSLPSSTAWPDSPPQELLLLLYLPTRGGCGLCPLQLPYEGGLWHHRWSPRLSIARCLGLWSEGSEIGGMTPKSWEGEDW